MMKAGTKVKFDNHIGVVVDWKKYPNFLKKTAAGKFDFRTEAIVKTVEGLHVVKQDQLVETVEGNEIRKVVEGRVVQRWNKHSGEFLGQEFVAGELSGYEDEHGNTLEGEDFIEPQSRAFEMVQDPDVVVEDEAEEKPNA